MKLVSKYWNNLLDIVYQLVHIKWFCFISIFIWIFSLIITLVTKNNVFYISSSLIIIVLCLLFQFCTQREFTRKLELKYSKHKKEDQEFENDLNLISTFNIKKCESIFDIPKRLLDFHEKYNKKIK